jgi:hypothetical protein
MLTQDLIKEYLYKIISDDDFINSIITTIPDDVAISAIIQKKSIQSSNNFRCYNTVSISKICYDLESEYNVDLVHIRNRTDMYYGNRMIDIQNMKNQIKKFYNPNFEA